MKIVMVRQIYILKTLNIFQMEFCYFKKII